MDKYFVTKAVSKTTKQNVYTTDSIREALDIQSRLNTGGKGDYVIAHVTDPRGKENRFLRWLTSKVG